MKTALMFTKDFYEKKPKAYGSWWFHKEECQKDLKIMRDERMKKGYTVYLCKSKNDGEIVYFLASSHGTHVEEGMTEKYFNSQVVDLEKDVISYKECVEGADEL